MFSLHSFFFLPSHFLIHLFFCLDGIDDSYPGTVSIQRIKKLINDMKQCVYMEASALTGDNVDAIFQTGKQNTDNIIT